jgi:hypothetical protein
MDPKRVRELVLLALLCAVNCGVALMYGQQFVALVLQRSLALSWLLSR